MADAADINMKMVDLTVYLRQALMDRFHVALFPASPERILILAQADTVAVFGGVLPSDALYTVLDDLVEAEELGAKACLTLYNRAVMWDEAAHVYGLLRRYYDSHHIESAAQGSIAVILDETAEAELLQESTSSGLPDVDGVTIRMAEHLRRGGSQAFLALLIDCAPDSTVPACTTCG